MIVVIAVVSTMVEVGALGSSAGWIAISAAAAAIIIAFSFGVVH